MKAVNILILTIPLLLIIGCDSDSGPGRINGGLHDVIQAFGCESGTVPLTGCWITEQCAEAQDGDDNFLGYWVRGAHHFATDGNIHYAQIKYNNDSCSGAPFDSSVFPNFFPESYVETGTELTSEGLDGHRITYTYDTTEYQVIYIITVENKLCFTSNVVFGPNYGSASVLGPNPTINYNECFIGEFTHF